MCRRVAWRAASCRAPPPANPDAAARRARARNARDTCSWPRRMLEIGAVYPKFCGVTRVESVAYEVIMLRLLLFVGTTLAIMLVLSIVVSLFGLDRWAYSHAGINLQGM